MKHVLRTSSVLFLLLSISCYCINAQPNTKLRPDRTVFLYLDSTHPITDAVQGKVLETMDIDMAESNGMKGAETLPGNGNLGNISEDARVDIYFPKKPNGQLVVVCPGGGYGYVSSYNEGIYVADWMLQRGITVAMAKYRLPNGHPEVPLTDIQNIIRYCRSNAENWGINKIGIIGFSAGGHLAASASTLYTDKTTRPDFSILIYPVTSVDGLIPSHKGTAVNLIGKEENWTSTAGKSADKWLADQKEWERLKKRFTLYNNITEDTPPTFIAHCSDDTVVPVINGIKYYNNLVNNKVSAEMHIYPTGGHGWGFSSAKFVDKDRIPLYRSEFETSLSRWLENLE